jgi:hypothetical protein
MFFKLPPLSFLSEPSIAYGYGLLEFDCIYQLDMVAVLGQGVAERVIMPLE